MISRIRKFSPYIALIGTAALIVGIALLLFSGGTLELKSEIPLAVGVVLLAVYILLNPALVRQAVTGRTARYGGNAFLMSITFIGILAMVNLLSARHHKRIDLTEAKEFSLSNQTVQVLKGLKQPVKITAFMRGGSATGQTLGDLLAEYAYYSDKLEYEIIDPDLKPAVARQFKIVSYNTVVYESEGRRQDAFGTQERDITAAILKVTGEGDKVVYFLTGHGERAIDDYSEKGASQLKLALERDSYKVKPLNLVITDTIPSDCVALVIARPTQDLLDRERNTIFKYLLGAGKLLVMQDPGYDGGVNKLLAGYFVRLNDDIIIDPVSSLLGDVAVPVVQRYPYSVITKDLPMTLFPQARSVEQFHDTKDVPGFTVSPLIKSTDKGWGETNLRDQRVRFDVDNDHKGPVNIAMTVESTAGVTPDQLKTKTSTKTRLVVFGDSDFASNAFLGSVGNLDLAVNSVDWLTEEEALLSIRPKDTQKHELVLSGGQARIIMYSSAIFLPLIVLAIGVGVWWNRR